MYLKVLAIIFGIAFIFAGIAGFLPALIENNLLFGWFSVDSMHNMTRLISGVLAVMAATRFNLARLYFQIIGIIYTIAAIVGIWRNGDLFVIQLNGPDNMLHLTIGIIALCLGFLSKKRATL